MKTTAEPNPQDAESYTSCRSNHPGHGPGHSARHKEAPVDDHSRLSQRQFDEHMQGEIPCPDADFDRPIEAGSLGILLIGTFIPVLLITAYGIACGERVVRLIIKHPVETLLECALILAVPFINLAVCKAVTRNDTRFAMRRGVLNGLSIGTSAVVSILTAVALALGYPVVDKATGTSYAGVCLFICGIAWLSLVASLYLANRLRLMREMRSSRLRSVAYSVAGALLALLAFAGAEARSSVIRVAENLAISHNRQDRLNGLKLLRVLKAERDLIMEGADARTAGIPGMFIPIEAQRLRPLYFAVTGKRYRSQDEVNMSALSDDYLKTHVVGPPVTGLSLLRSSLTGAVHPETLSTGLTWTFVFSNDNATDQEARAEIALPPGAVVNGLTWWFDGKKEKARVVPTGSSLDARRTLTVNHQEPAIVTDLGRGRVLLHCFPVPSHGEMKVLVNIAAPLKPNATGITTLSLPRLAETNFGLEGDHSMLLRGPDNVRLEMQGAQLRPAASGKRDLVRSLSDEDLKGPGFTVGIGDVPEPRVTAVRCPASSCDEYIVQTVEKVKSPAPKDLVVVIDGSLSAKAQYEQIRASFQKLPVGLRASLILATESRRDLKAVPLREGLARLEPSSFSGGQDNLEAVVKAAELAGGSSNGAVLWIHGPQPGYSKEIYLMAPYVAKPKFYEIALDNGDTDIQEFLKNHDDVGPVTSIPRTGTLQSDLARFFDHWNGGEVEYLTRYERVATKPVCPVVWQPDRAREVAAIWARARCEELRAKGDLQGAAAVAVEQGIVSPVSLSAVFSEGNRALMNRVASSGNFENGSGVIALQNTVGEAAGRQSPLLESLGTPPVAGPLGAVNGTVGSPVGAEPAVIVGVNTAGCVRVNNLANLETLLNLIANGIELLCLAFGGWLVIGAIVLPGQSVRLFGCTEPLSRSSRIINGVIIALLGLATPSTINWFVASARDCNLFS